MGSKGRDFELENSDHRQDEATVPIRLWPLICLGCTFVTATVLLAPPPLRDWTLRFFRVAPDSGLEVWGEITTACGFGAVVYTLWLQIHNLRFQWRAHQKNVARVDEERRDGQLRWEAEQRRAQPTFSAKLREPTGDGPPLLAVECVGGTYHLRYLSLRCDDQRMERALEWSPNHGRAHNWLVTEFPVDLERGEHHYALRWRDDGGLVWEQGLLLTATGEFVSGSESPEDGYSEVVTHVEPFGPPRLDKSASLHSTIHPAAPQLGIESEWIEVGPTDWACTSAVHPGPDSDLYFGIRTIDQLNRRTEKSG